MSALGQKQTCAAQKDMSALPPKADISRGVCPLNWAARSHLPQTDEPYRRGSRGAGADHLIRLLFLIRAHFDSPHCQLSLSPGSVNCIGSQCYRSYVRDRGLIDDSTFLCRAITHNIKFCGPSTRRKKRE